MTAVPRETTDTHHDTHHDTNGQANHPSTDGHHARARNGARSAEEEARFVRAVKRWPDAPFEVCESGCGRRIAWAREDELAEPRFGWGAGWYEAPCFVGGMLTWFRHTPQRCRMLRVGGVG